MNEWELVFRAISDPALVLDNDHKVLSSNPAADRAAGVEPGGLIGLRCHEVFHCTDHAPDGCPHVALGKLQMPVTLEMEMQTMGGTYLVTVAPILDETGTLERTIHIAKDISDRKRAEKALRESEERFRAIFDGARDGILLADTDQKKFLMGNRAIRRMLGYSSAELRELSVADIHSDEDLPFVIEQFEAQRKSDLAVAVDLPVQRKDGSVFHADIASAPIRIGNREYLIGSFRDVSERIQLEQATLEARDRVIRQMQKHESYVHEVADRLRNPLQILMGYLELMPADHLSATQQRYIEHIHKASERLLQGLQKLT
jgi:PAS domain S-box-containing protein